MIDPTGGQGEQESTESPPGLGCSEPEVTAGDLLGKDEAGRPPIINRRNSVQPDSTVPGLQPTLPTNFILQYSIDSNSTRKVRRVKTAHCPTPPSDLGDNSIRSSIIATGENENYRVGSIYLTLGLGDVIMILLVSINDDLGVFCFPVDSI
jgi:hypothetical protein